MLPLLLEHDPSVYFLTHHSSRKVSQLEARPQVALTYRRRRLLCCRARNGLGPSGPSTHPRPVESNLPCVVPWRRRRPRGHRASRRRGARRLLGAAAQPPGSCRPSLEGAHHASSC
jgi:hypothetical protein